MIKAIKKWLGIRTLEEAYQQGRSTAAKILKENRALGRSDELTAKHIYEMGFGTFNTTPGERAFDRGIQDYLYDLGYDEDGPTK